MKFTKTLGILTVVTTLMAGSHAIASERAFINAFGASDRNGSETLSASEFKLFAKLLAAQGNQQALEIFGSGSEDFSEGFSSYDEDGDGEISYEEASYINE